MTHGRTALHVWHDRQPTVDAKTFKRLIRLTEDRARRIDEAECHRAFVNIDVPKGLVLDLRTVLSAEEMAALL
jgi:hypothetical protein